MDGIQAAERIWNHLQIPIIYVTGHSDKSTLERAKATSPFGYILKPVKGRELYVAIETALNRYEREQLLTPILKSMGDGMIAVNTHGRILFLNQSAELLTGWQHDEARDRDLTEVFNVVSEETRLSIGNVSITAMQQDTIILLRDRLLLIAKDGTALPITDSVAPVKDYKGSITGAVLVFRDNTQRQLQEEHNRTLERAQILQQQKEELQRLNQLKDDFLSTVSHELRAPLTNIKLAIQMLEVTLNQQVNLDTDRVTRYMHILRDQCNRELSLVNDLLDLQQLEAGARLVEWFPIHLNTWILQRVSAFQERAQNREQQLQVLVPAELPVLVSDSAILTRIFTELLVNACKYTPPGGEITITARTQSEYRIQLAVCNTGVEIPTNELTRIFDKFYRIPTSDRWQQGGTGMGLALIKKLVTYLGGAIWAESIVGQTCFIVEFPLSPTNDV